MAPQILLVDDNPIQAVTRRAILERTGATVKTFLSAKEALRYIESATEGDFRMIITDHIMPEMSGTAFVCGVRKWSKRVPIVVLSGLAEAEQEYQEYNVVFRTKPVSPDELQALAVGIIDTAIPLSA